MEEKADGAGGRAGASMLDRRRSQRVVIRIGVTIHITAPEKATSIRAYTQDVNVHGALLTTPLSFPPGTHFEVENNQTRERQLCRVTRPPQTRPDGFHVPVEFERAAPNFWKISFPPTDWKPLES